MPTKKRTHNRKKKSTKVHHHYVVFALVIGIAFLMIAKLTVLSNVSLTGWLFTQADAEKVEPIPLWEHGKVFVNTEVE